MTAWTGYYAELSTVGDPPKSTPLLALETFQALPRLGDSPNFALGGTRTTVVAALPNRVHDGYLAASMYEFFYKGIYLIPSTVNFGNLVNDKTLTFKIWNAEFVSHTMDAVSAEGADGILLESIPLPVVFGPLHVRTYQIEASTLGPAALNAVYTFGFTDFPDLYLSVVGQRLVAWTFKPNWANGVLERLAWLTDVMVSDTAAEQRRSLRDAPRREFEAEMLIHDYDRQYYEMAMYAWGGRVWLLPIWPDVQELQSIATASSMRLDVPTTGRDYFAGGFAILIGADSTQYEIVEIASFDANGLNTTGGLTSTWPKGSLIYPARPARLITQPSASRLTDWTYTVAVQFLVEDECEWPAAMPAETYLGLPVLSQRPDESENLTRGYQRMLLSLDAGISRPYVADTADRALTLLGFRWFLAGITAANEHRQLLYALRGRFKALWIPTHANDLTLALPVLLSDTYINVRNVGYSRFGGVGRVDIRVELVDGTSFMRRIVSAVQITSAIERLNLDSSLGVELAIAEVARISWMSLMRLDTDTIEIQHETDVEGLAISQTIFKEVRDNEL